MQSTKETCRMAFSPQSAPVYGGKTVVVAFADENSLPTIEKELYLIFEGSETRHVTSVNRLNTYTLQAVIPGHDRSEVVKLSVCNFERNQHHIVASGEFTFMDDPINDFSRWLLNSVRDISALDNSETIIQESGFDYLSEDRSFLDVQLTSAFENLNLPQSWSIVGDDARLEHDPPPRETLLHFAIRESLTQFAQMLLSKAGSQIAVRLPNKVGDLPRDLALERGLDSLAESMLESNEDSSISKWETGQSQTTIRKHSIGTATISNRVSGNSEGIDEAIKMLREVTSLMKGDARKRLKLSHNWSRVDIDENELRDNQNSPSSGLYIEQRAPSPKHQAIHEDEGIHSSYNENTSHLAIPTISVTDPLDNNHILEENLRRLHDISEDIQKKRENKQTLLLVEDIRKDHLSRFSTSCPSLANELTADSFQDNNLQPANSMVTVLPSTDDEDDEPRTNNLTVGVTETLSDGHNGSVHFDSEIRICVNDVTVDSSTTDFVDDEAQDTVGSLDNRNHGDRDTDNHGWGAPIPASPKKKKPRRHSWCPVSEKVAKTQKKSYEEDDTVLIKTGRIMSISSSDEDSSNMSEDEFHDAEDTVICEGEVDTSTETVANAHSPGSGPSEQSSAANRPSSQTSVRSLTDVGYEVAGLSDNDELDSRRRSLSQSSMDSASDVLLPQQPLHKPIQKAVSVGAIHMMKDGEHGHRQDSILSQPETKKEKRTAKDSHLLLQELIKQHDEEQGREEGEAADVYSDDLYQNFLRSKKRTKARMSLTEFLCDPRNFDGNEEQQVTATRQAELLQSTKGETEKKSSSLSSKAFNLFRMPSTRPRNKDKSKDKDSKNKTTHQYMAISFSNSTKCDCCEKPLVNKDALQCQACLINVHNNSCKDNMGNCSKFAKHLKQQKITASSFRDKLSINKQHSVSMTALQTSQSFSVKDRPRSVHIPIKAGQSNSLPSSYSASKLSSSPAKTSSLGRQRRELFHALHRQPSSSSCGSQPISEENEGDLPFCNSQSNISETMSASMESLEETDGVDFDDDPDLMIKGPEPESWSVTVDKKTLKKMSHKDIKRQDVIYELIQTEKHHVRTLKIMQRIFWEGMQHELHMDQSIIDKMFPMLGEIMEISTAFLDKLRARQQENKAVEKIGDILVNQFSDKNGSGERMKLAYGIFCAHQREAVSIYKELLKSDRKFQSFIKKCSQNALCRRWSIPECILAVTHRLTKYPLLIEAVIKVTKASKPDYQQLHQANTLVKNILNSVDAQVQDYEREQRRLAIYNKIDARSSVTLRSGKKFKKSDLLANNRKLLHEGEVQWRSARGKHTEVQAVLLTDVLTFLQDNNQKYTFLNLDQKVAVVPLQKLMVRNVATDKQSIYLISPHKAGPEMYEIMCNSTDERDHWRARIEEAVKNCPDEDEGVVEEENVVDEERKQGEARAAKVTALLDQMQEKDTDLNNTLSEKWKLLVEVTELIGKAEASGITKLSYKVESAGSESPNTREILLAAIQEASKLTSAVYGAGGLSRSATSVGESESGTYQSPSLPKRAETFGGFDSSAKDQSILPKAGALKKRLVTPHIDSETRSSSSPNLTKGENIGIPELNEHSNRRGSATRSLSDADKKEAARRRECGSAGASGSAFLHDALQRNSSESLKFEREERLSETGSDRGSSGELSSTVTDSGVVGVSAGYVPPTVEQVTSVAQLTHYLNSLLSVVAQRDTEYERMKTQVTEETDNKAKVEKLQQELEKSQKKEEEQEEQLKKLKDQLKLTEIQLSQEKEELAEEKEKHLKEVEQLEEELKRDKEYIQQMRTMQDYEQMQAIHHRQGSSSSLGSYGDGSVSSDTTVEWVSTTPQTVYGSAETLTDLSSGRTSADVSTVTGHAGHGRGGGDHSHNFGNVLVPHLHPYSKGRAASEPVRTDVPDSTLPHEDARGRRGSDGKNLPIHLYSTTNEMGRQGVNLQQQLPAKLMSKEKGKKSKKDKDRDKERGVSPSNHHAHTDRTSRTASPNLPLPGSQIHQQYRNVAKPSSHAAHMHGVRTAGFQRSQTENVSPQVAMEKSNQLYHQQSLPTQVLADPHVLSRTMPQLNFYHHQQQQQQTPPQKQQQQQQQPSQEPPASPEGEVLYF